MCPLHILKPHYGASDRHCWQLNRSYKFDRHTMYAETLHRTPHILQALERVCGTVAHKTLVPENMLVCLHTHKGLHITVFQSIMTITTTCHNNVLRSHSQTLCHQISRAAWIGGEHGDTLHQKNKITHPQLTSQHKGH